MGEVTLVKNTTPIKWMRTDLKAIIRHLVVTIWVLIDEFSIGIDGYDVSLSVISRMEARGSLSKTIFTFLTTKIMVERSLSIL